LASRFNFCESDRLQPAKPSHIPKIKSPLFRLFIFSSPFKTQNEVASSRRQFFNSDSNLRAIQSLPKINSATYDLVFWPADQTPYLYVKERYNVSTITDVEHPDFEEFPLFAKATQTSFTLRPGEILYMPPGLWHATKMLSPCISPAMNRANAANWSSFTHDAIARVPWYLKPPTAAYMFAMGKFRQALGH